MTVKIRARHTANNVNLSTAYEYFLLEVSPQRVFVPLGHGNDMFSLPIPWTYVVCNIASRHGLYIGQMPSQILASHRPISSVDDLLGVPPLFALYREGGFCSGSIRTALPTSADTHDRLLACLRAGLFTTAAPGYAAYTVENPSFRYLQELAGLSSKVYESLMTLVRKVYEYWESLEAFPPEAPLDRFTVPKQFPELLDEPTILVTTDEGGSG